MRLKTPTYRSFVSASEASSRAMRGNRPRDTTPEILLRRAIWGIGLRYRKNVAWLPGKPDLAFLGAHVVVFCDGDFWHGRNWKLLRRKLLKRANSTYWIDKIAYNRERDRRIRGRFRREGWLVIELWESDIVKDPEAAALRIRDSIKVALLEDSLQSPSGIKAKSGLLK